MDLVSAVSKIECSQELIPDAKAQSIKKLD
jgi:hypothetical protein